MQLKTYQQRSLDVLSRYFKTCKQLNDADVAFYVTTRELDGEARKYHQVEELPGLPYICLRVPTGGGKTFMACYAVDIATKDFLGVDHSFVLWLTPSTTIRDQTLKALKDRKHPYRSALESTLGSITVLELSEALYVQPPTLNTDTVILVSTTQAFRVEDAELRKVYEPAGALMSHFDNVPVSAEIDRYDNGKPVPSLANLLRLHRPIVIVDEAHNVRTKLSFDTLARFNPSCILELTATPHLDEHPSNVLYSISARELKAEAMIKLPIRLETRPEWKELIGDAILKLNELEVLAEAERAQTGEYIRPIMLLQAQPNRAGQKTITVELVESCLKEDYSIPADQIARATGIDDEIGDTDLTAPGPIRYIITIQKLREGWDCPFAYVLCSVAEQHGATAVEQIIGRVLRMPKAERKQKPELNLAYAYVASRNFFDTLNNLADALVENGFEKQEAEELITQQTFTGLEGLPLGMYQALDEQVISVKVVEAPALEKIPAELAQKINYSKETHVLELPANITQEEIEAIKPAFKDEESRTTFEHSAIENKARFAATKATPSERGEVFSVPVLGYRQGKLLEQLEETHFLDFHWELPKKDAILNDEEFPAQRAAPKQGEVDVDEMGKIKREFLSNLQDQLTLLKADYGWRVSDLVYWLDRNFLHHDLTATETGIYLTALINNLIEKRTLLLEILVREKYRLRDAVVAKIDKYRNYAHEQAFKAFFQDGSAVEVTPELVFSFDPQEYPCPVNSLYRRQHNFKKHYYPDVGRFDSGEEKQCAEFIDSMDEVEYWVRNINNQPSHSFWFQTSTDRFYPDFVCKIKDGRYLVVEYKGKDRYDNPEEKEKRDIGELWEKRSKGKCLFVMPTDKKNDVIRVKIG